MGSASLKLNNNLHQNMKILVLILGLISTCFAAPNKDAVRWGDSSLEQRIPNSCNTRQGETCVFPFSCQGVTHYQCTYSDSPTPWCATQTDSSGAVVTNKWGDCDHDSVSSSCTVENINIDPCTTPTGQCVFPFRYKGTVYSSCTTVDRVSSWCSTKTDIHGEHIEGNEGSCPSTCAGYSGCPGCTSTSTTTTTSSSSSSCLTVSGPDTGSQCIFPFTFNSVTYVSCADWVYGGEFQGEKWCSTKVDSSGVHVNGEGKYGICSSDCSPAVSLAAILNGLGLTSDQFTRSASLSSQQDVNFNSPLPK